MREEKKTNGFYIVGWIATIAQIAVSAAVLVLLHRAGLLPTKLEAAAAAVLVICVLIGRFLMRKKAKKGSYIVAWILIALLCAILAYAGGKISQLTDTLQTITDATEETTRMGVYVLAEDEAESIEDAAGYRFGIMKELTREDGDNAVAQIEEALGQEVITAEYDGVADMADAVLSGDSKAIILNEDFVDMITEIEGYEEFDTQVKEIASYEWKTVVETAADAAAEAESQEDAAEDGVFIMYMSGIDTFGAISTKSRSDVNIIAVVNSNTHKILLVSTPRDYYVPLSISNGVKDKLTHAGIYGIDVSVDTLEELYGINIDYYFRVNFSGFEEMIDALGGITVQSDYTFDVAPSFHYVAGSNEVNGEEALAFARERHAFAEGDRQRGKNQMAVITGVIQKLQTPAVLQNFTGLMSGLEGSFETDMPYSLLADMVKDQLSGGSSWSVESYSVDGTGTMASTYSISRPLYVMQPDQSTVDEAVSKIQAVVNGEAE